MDARLSLELSSYSKYSHFWSMVSLRSALLQHVTLRLPTGTWDILLSALKSPQSYKRQRVLLHICKRLAVNLSGMHCWNPPVRWWLQWLMGSSFISGLKVHVKTRKSSVLNSYCCLITGNRKDEDDQMKPWNLYCTQLGISWPLFLYSWWNTGRFISFANTYICDFRCLNTMRMFLICMYRVT